MKTCIFVGNGVIEKELGSLIDSYDHVYRFNRFVTKGFEKIVGTRCTHWILNNALVTDSRDYFRKNISRVKKTHTEFLQAYVVTTSTNQESILKNIKTKYNMFDYVIDTSFEGGFFKHKPSTGVVALKQVIKKYKQVDLVGFDFGQTNHYWGVETQSDRPGKHDWVKEKKYVENLITQKKIKLL